MSESNGGKAKKALDAGKDAVVKSKEAVIKALDQDGNGLIDSTDLIILALKQPGIKIKRDVFLQKELARYCTPETIDAAITSTPAEAKIDSELIEEANVSIWVSSERNGGRWTELRSWDFE